jgi:hypothetical protein
MSTEQNKATVRRWLEGFNRGNADLQEALAEEVYTTDFCGHGFGPTLEDGNGSPRCGMGGIFVDSTLTKNRF